MASDKIEQIHILCLQPVHMEPANFLEMLRSLNYDEDGARFAGWHHRADADFMSGHPWLHCLCEGPQAKALDVLVKREEGAGPLTAVAANLAALGQQDFVQINLRQSGVYTLLVNNAVFMALVHLVLDVIKPEPDVQRWAVLPGLVRMALPDSADTVRLLEDLTLASISTLTEEAGCPVDKAQLHIPRDTCHILSVYEGRENAAEAFLQGIHGEEEIDMATAQNVIPGATEPYFAHFGWSYTTLSGVGVSQAALCLQFMLYLQAFWFLLRYLFSYLYSNMKQLSLKGEVVSDLKKKFNDYDVLVVFYQTCIMRHAQFAASLKPWQHSAFDRTQAYWKITESMEKIERTMSANRELIERKISYFNQSIQNKQSTALFAITILQSLTIVGFFNDYFSLIKLDEMPDKFGFISQESLASFIFTLPALILATAIGLTMLVYGSFIGGALGRIKRALFKR